jgi:hypothetical protein
MHLISWIQPRGCETIMVTTEEELYCYWLKAIVISILMFYEPVYQETN